MEKTDELVLKKRMFILDRLISLRNTKIDFYKNLYKVKRDSLPPISLTDANIKIKLNSISTKNCDSSRQITFSNSYKILTRDISTKNKNEIIPNTDRVRDKETLNILYSNEIKSSVSKKNIKNSQVDSNIKNQPENVDKKQQPENINKYNIDKTGSNLIVHRIKNNNKYMLFSKIA